jgi:predicted HicB family RNase H-like nuclease
VSVYSRRVMWSEEDEAFVALSPEFPALSGLGDTPTQALDELTTVLAEAVDIMRIEGKPVPDPLVHRGFSGQFRLRVPVSLHARLADRAAVEGVSLNTLAVRLLSDALARL